MEAIDSAIVSLVGWAPKRPTHIVVDDPYGISNGYVLPFVNRPTSIWWAVPADPRSEIGNYLTWGEMLAAHELTHIAHLTRPTRNRLQNLLWSLLPENIGPIARRSPRWVYEGYATFAEGRITGSGRPNHVWAPALLRQWAIEGALPTYGQLSGSSGFEGGEFAYVGGSAFLEWLARREGDSSFVSVWRRMTARRTRGFDAAFAGVFGDVPAALYGRHNAELTRDAMAAKAALERAGIVDGELVQRLDWGTGDPAISPNGQFVAITIRERDRPQHIEIWRTAPERADTATERRSREMLARDPEDVADRHFFPARKRPARILYAVNGRGFSAPRWMSDNQRVLLTRWVPRRDGSIGPDLYIWNIQTNRVQRITHGGNVQNPDAARNGDEIIASQCHKGRCDVARVDPERGTMTIILQGTPERSYYRPRLSPDGRQIVASVSDSGRWRIVVAGRDGSQPHYVDPDDGASRYDATWARGDTLLVVSERGGIPNLELLSSSTRETRALSRVTGAAVAPDVNRADGSIWFLALHSRGYDVRRLPNTARTAAADSVVQVASDRFGFAGLRSATIRPIAAQTLDASHPYGAGPRRQRWLPGGYYSTDGGGAFLTIFTGDIVGRFNGTAIAAYGFPGTWRGASAQFAWRFLRPTLELGAHAYSVSPSLGPNAQAGSDALDVRAAHGVVALTTQGVGDAWYIRGRAGAAFGAIEPRLNGIRESRALGFGELSLSLQQTTNARGAVERFYLHVAQGRTVTTYKRVVGGFAFRTVGRDAWPFMLSASAGKLFDSPHPFEQFVLGGAASPIVDSSALKQIYAMPEFPTGIATGNAFVAWRAAYPTQGWTYFFEGASTAPGLRDFRKWNRAIGIETGYTLPPVPYAYAPRIETRTGIAYTLDEPFRRKLRLYAEMRMNP